MNAQNNPIPTIAEQNREAKPNGGGAAALLAAGIGSFGLAVLAILVDQVGALKNAMIFFRPTGPLSGVTTIAVLIWLAVWAILEWRWRKKTIRMGGIAAASLVLLVLALLLTFPPLADLF
ncbi:MAG TPA: hypothetical protein VMA31_08210 [Bryobacteraceae bacterium]|nr:hypothetical protein [Bryobacteraceae bacterium]